MIKIVPFQESFQFGSVKSLVIMNLSKQAKRVKEVKDKIKHIGSIRYGKIKRSKK
jgi:hypothetical protein